MARRHDLSSVWRRVKFVVGSSKKWLRVKVESEFIGKAAASMSATPTNIYTIYMVMC